MKVERKACFPSLLGSLGMQLIVCRGASVVVRHIIKVAGL